jgi:hypothetical protein
LRYSRVSWLRCKKVDWNWERHNLENTGFYNCLGIPAVGTRKAVGRKRQHLVKISQVWGPCPTSLVSLASAYISMDYIPVGPNEHLIVDIDHIGVSTLRLTYSQ